MLLWITNRKSAHGYDTLYGCLEHAIFCVLKGKVHTSLVVIKQSLININKNYDLRIIQNFSYCSDHRIVDP